MTAERPHPKRTFFWQGLLIVLPVVILATLGLFSLRQDKLLARQEAANRGQTLADDLLTRFWSELTDSNASTAEVPKARLFQVNAAGELVSPSPVPLLPSPRMLDDTALTPDQRELWRAARVSEAKTVDTDPQSTIRAWQQFLQANPSEEFAAIGSYALAAQYFAISNLTASAALFGEVMEKFPEAVGETGLPLASVAQFKLLEIDLRTSGSAARLGTSIETVCSNLVTRPTPLTGYFLQQIAEKVGTGPEAAICTKWSKLWQEDQIARALYQAAGPLHTPVLLSEASAPVLVWFRADLPEAGQKPTQVDGRPAPHESGVLDWVAMETSGTVTNRTFACFSEPALGARLSGLVERERYVPDYLAIRLSVAGRPIVKLAPEFHAWRAAPYMSKGGGGFRKEILDQQPTELLATATKPGHGQELAQLSVYLANPGALFKAQRARTFWFGLLVACSAIAALIGFGAAWRAFRRQLQLSELKSNFVSSVSHELRAPIASVRLMAESLASGKVAEEQKRGQYFRFISQECRRLSSLIENVLDFSRIDQGRKSYEFEPTNLRALTEATVKLMEPYASERGVGLSLNIPSRLQAEPIVDGKAVQQALVNLIDNAIKHSPKGETVTIGLEMREGTAGSSYGSGGLSDAGPGSFAIWVEDHGPGIPAEEHEKIFERFYRLGSELRRETAGVGIGLSIVKHIVENHGGSVHVRSAPGQGSRFTIELPLAAAPARKPTERP